MIENLLPEIAATPNAPFLYGAGRDLVRRILTNKEIPNLSIKEDEFALYARVKRGNPQKCLIVVTHIDHPAIVLKNEKYGIVFGSVGYERIRQMKRINLFSQTHTLYGTFLLLKESMA